MSIFTSTLKELFTAFGVGVLITIILSAVIEYRHQQRRDVIILTCPKSLYTTVQTFAPTGEPFYADTVPYVEIWRPDVQVPPGIRATPVSTLPMFMLPDKKGHYGICFNVWSGIADHGHTYDVHVRATMQATTHEMRLGKIENGKFQRYYDQPDQIPAEAR